MYPVVGTLPFHHHHPQFNDYESMSLRASKMPSFFQQDPVYYPPQPDFYQFQPVQQSFSTTTTVIIINNRPNNFYLPTNMQLPTASNHSPSSQMSTVPAHYNSYFSPSSHSRPIQINAPSSAAAGRYTSYNGMDRVMGLDFDQPSTNNTINNNNNNTSSNNIDSVYLMDFMDDENPPASSSVTQYSMRTDSIEDIFRRAFVSPSTEENKENNTSTAPAAVSGASASLAAPAPRLPPSPSPPKPGFSSSSNVPRPLSSPTLPAHQQILSNIKICGPPGGRSFKRLSSYDDEALINEETESEAGFSGDDECMSNCGCVHSCIGSPIDFAPPTVFENQPFTRLGFRSIGDIIGYAQVVKAERLEALAELRNAVDKFNDMRQRKSQNLAKLNSATSTTTN